MPKLEWFRVRRDEDLRPLVGWVKARPVNTYNLKTDRKGDRIILLGYDSKPNSDWGKFQGNTAAIWFATPELADAGETAVQRAFGWPDEASA